ncbi:MAG: halocyanin domain-containing protein [Salinigranum sp.]
MSDSPTTRSGVTRRTLLRTAAGAGIAASAGFAGVGAAQSGPDYGGWFDGVGNYDGNTVDLTGNEQVTVTVGADGNGGTFAFSPPAIRIDPGTTVTFDWVSDTHTVSVENQPDGANWEGHDTIEDTGFTYKNTFQTKGIYEYYCIPHRSLGMKGAIVVGGSGGVSPQEAGVPGAVGPPSGGGGQQGGGSQQGGSQQGGQGQPSGGANGGEGGGGGVAPPKTGFVAMFLAAVAAFLSPIAFAILLVINHVDDEGPNQGEVEYRPGTEQ